MPQTGRRVQFPGWLTNLRRSQFVRNASVVLVGTALAQVFPLVTAPMLSRLYTTEEFGLFGLFLSIATFLSVLFSIRMNVAVLLPRSRTDAAHLLGVGLLATASLAAVLLGVAVVLRDPLSDLIGEPLFAPYVPWVVVGAALLAAYGLGYAWMNRESMFKRMAASRVVQSGGIATAQVGAGLAGAGSVGLIGGLLAGQALGNLLPAWASRSAVGMASRSGMRTQLRRYRNFPLVSLPADLVNSASNQLPVILLATFFGASTVGLYNLTVRVIAAPAQLLQTAVLDAYRQRAALDYAEAGTCRPIYLKTMRTLAVLALPPALIVGVWGPDLFAFVFGDPWREAGVYARLLVPWFYTGFIASPLGYTLYIAERQGTDLVWQIILLLLVNGSIWAGALLGGAAWSVGLFSASYSAMYLVYLVLSYRATVAPSALSS